MNGTIEKLDGQVCTLKARNKYLSFENELMKSKQDLLNSDKILLQSEILSREVVMLREKDRSKISRDNNYAFSQLKVLEHEMNVLRKDWEKSMEANEQLDIERTHLKSHNKVLKKENQDLLSKLTESDITAGHNLSKLKSAIEAEFEHSIMRKDREIQDWLSKELMKMLRQMDNDEQSQKNLTSVTKELAAQKLSFSNLLDKYSSLVRSSDEMGSALNGYKNWNDVLRSKLSDAENSVVESEG